MHSTIRSFPSVRTVLLIGLTASCSSCAVIAGYPADLEDSKALITKLRPYFDPSQDDAYSQETDAVKRQAKRDVVVLARVRAYDIEFSSYEKSLWGSANTVTLGGDMVALALGGLATTAAATSTKTAFSAASTGVIGANAAINRDLYYQRTLPALLAQMEANRAKAKLKLLAGIKQSDAQYPLSLAEVDLSDLKSAGSMPDAVGAITQQATNQHKTAQDNIDTLRSGSFSTSTTSKTLRDWVSPGGTVNQGRVTALQNWMNADTTDQSLHGLPPEMLIDLDNQQMESDRVRAISALNVQ